ncbi:hypothetical protein FM106_15270 [Brachybacterium faecium]|nr:hypothetical protein FM106_15270 [Brachybacterium faecium]
MEVVFQLGEVADNFNSSLINFLCDLILLLFFTKNHQQHKL